MAVQFGDFIQLAILLATIVPLLLALHQQNKARGQRIENAIGELTAQSKRHDKRTRKTRKLILAHIEWHNIADGGKYLIERRSETD